MSVLDGVNTALITGASGGIGGAFARQLAAMGKELVLVARNEEPLRALARELAGQYTIRAQAIPLDLAVPSAARRLFDETEHQGLSVDLLVNNAGFCRVGDFCRIPAEVQAGMIFLNVSALVELTWLYLPAMRRRQRGGIINLASTSAFQPVPYMSVYAASKAFVLHFSEGLAEEVRGDGVTVMALCPGATATDFWRKAGAWEERLGSMPSPDAVVAGALRAFECRKTVHTDGFWNRLVAFSTRLGPRRLVARIASYVFRNQL
jgi:short-subunit dehydrogenase